jgi:hypothetical protein
MTRTYRAAAGGTDMKVSGVASDGTAVAQSAALTYDGKDVPFTGSSDYDTLSLKKVLSARRRTRFLGEARS